MLSLLWCNNILDVLNLITCFALWSKPGHDWFLWLPFVLEFELVFSVIIKMWWGRGWNIWKQVSTGNCQLVVLPLCLLILIIPICRNFCLVIYNNNYDHSSTSEKNRRFWRLIFFPMSILLVTLNTTFFVLTYITYLSWSDFSTRGATNQDSRRRDIFGLVSLFPSLLPGLALHKSRPAVV